MLKVNNLIGFGAGLVDPYKNNVVAQSNLRLADNTTSYTDDTGKAFSLLNGGQVTGQAIVLDGVNDYGRYDSLTSDFDFGSGDFTLEGFYLPIPDDSFQSLFALLPNSQTSGRAALQAGFYSDGRLWFGIDTSDATSLAEFDPYDGKVHHLAWSRKNGVAYLCVDGKMVYSAPLATSVPTPSDRVLKLGVAVISGVNAYSNSYEGSILSYRITKGVGRYTSDYQVPNVGNYKFPAI